MLCSCSVNSGEIFYKLDEVFATYVKDDVPKHNNNNTKYYSFYLPSDIKELEYDNIFHHLVFNCSDFVMNLNINNIMSKNVFNTQSDDPYSFLDGYVVYSYTGSYQDSGNIYKFDVYYYNDEYLFSFYSDNLSFFGKTVLSDVPELARHLLILNDSVIVETDKVVDDYYSGTTIDFTKEQVNLFDTYHSADGQLSDLLPD